MHLKDLLTKKHLTASLPRKDKILRDQFDEATVIESFLKVAPKYGKHGRFDIDNENREVLELLMLYFTNNPAFNQYPVHTESKPSALRTHPDIDKGIILAGNSGSGKTVLLEIFSEMKIPGNYFRCVPCDEITDSYKRNSISALDRYRIPFLQHMQYATYENIFLFDDLGFERKFKEWGSDIDCMMDIIMKRNRLFTEFGVRSLFTTNCTMDQLEKYYDTRTASRLYGMCNVIYLGAKADSLDRRQAA